MSTSSAAIPPAGVGGTEIDAALRMALEPLELVVRDDSHLHAGHAGAREGRHFSVLIVSPRFNGLSRLARHRLVYDSLHALIPRGIHALAIDARAPGDA
jgi:BolA protein